jgi:hypothetical protein
LGSQSPKKEQIFWVYDFFRGSLGLFGVFFFSLGFLMRNDDDAFFMMGIYWKGGKEREEIKNGKLLCSARSKLD